MLYLGFPMYSVGGKKPAFELERVCVLTVPTQINYCNTMLTILCHKICTRSPLISLQGLNVLILTVDM